MGNVPVMQSVRAAYAFWRIAWRPAAGALGLLAAITTLQGYWNLRDQMGLYAVLAAVATVVGGIIAAGALYRLAFADERPGDPAFRPGPGGLQWGAMEWRLLGANLIVLLFVIIAAMLVAVLLIVAVVMLAGGAGLEGNPSPEDIAELIGTPGALLLVALMCVLFAVIVYVAVRLVLVMPATAASGRVQVFETWPLTKGQFWPIFGAVLLVAVPTIVTSIVTGVFVNVVGEEGARDGSRILAPPAALAVALVNALVGAFVQAPLSAGLGAYLYRGLRRADQAPPAVPAQTPAV